MNKENIYLQSTNVDNTTHTHYTSERRKTKNNKKGLYSESFSDIQLQLHAFTVVNNPYVFTIDRNTTFKSTIKKKIELPDKNTVLYSKVDNNGDEIHFSITIPEGVNIINIVCTADFYEQYDNGFIDIINQSNKKNWAYDNNVYTSDMCSDLYIQVTPGKTYNLIASAEAMVSYIWHLQISVLYSKIINQHKPGFIDL